MAEKIENNEQLAPKVEKLKNFFILIQNEVANDTQTKIGKKQVTQFLSSNDKIKADLVGIRVSFANHKTQNEKFIEALATAYLAYIEDETSIKEIAERLEQEFQATAQSRQLASLDDSQNPEQKKADAMLDKAIGSEGITFTRAQLALLLVTVLGIGALIGNSLNSNDNDTGRAITDTPCPAPELKITESVSELTSEQLELFNLTLKTITIPRQSLASNSSLYQLEELQYPSISFSDSLQQIDRERGETIPAASQRLLALLNNIENWKQFTVELKAAIDSNSLDLNQLLENNLKGENKLKESIPSKRILGDKENILWMLFNFSQNLPENHPAYYNGRLEDSDKDWLIDQSNNNGLTLSEKQKTDIRQAVTIIDFFNLASTQGSEGIYYEAIYYKFLEKNIDKLMPLLDKLSELIASQSQFLASDLNGQSLVQVSLTITKE